MKILAKFKCETIVDTKTQHLQDRHVFFKAVTTDSEENKSFSKYTPAAELSMNISKDTSAYDYFEPGSEYYITLEKV